MCDKNYENQADSPLEENPIFCGADGAFYEPDCFASEGLYDEPAPEPLRPGNQIDELKAVWDRRNPAVWSTLTLDRLGQALRGPFTGNAVDWERLCFWAEEELSHSGEYDILCGISTGALIVNMELSEDAPPLVMPMPVSNWVALAVLVRQCIRIIHNNGAELFDRDTRIADYLKSVMNLVVPEAGGLLNAPDLFARCIGHTVLGFDNDPFDRMHRLETALLRDLDADSTLEDLILWLERGGGGACRNNWGNEMLLFKAALVRNTGWMEITEEDFDEDPDSWSGFDFASEIF